MKTGLPYSWNHHSISWNARGLDSSDSVPLGNGDIAINLWVEDEGDLLFYIAKSDAFSEHNQLLKLGRVRVSLKPNPFSGKRPFQFSLDVSRGIASVLSEGLKIEVWVDAFSPNIFVNIEDAAPFVCSVKLENWRQFPRPMSTALKSVWDFGEIMGVVDRVNCPEPFITIEPDRFFEEKDAILWAHCNPTQTVWDEDLRKTGCDSFPEIVYNPLRDRITGAVIASPQLHALAPLHLATKEATQRCTIAVTCLSRQEADVEIWKTDLRALQPSLDHYDDAREKHVLWWMEKFGSHFIRISGDQSAEHVGMCYQLQRYMQLCAGRGIGPIHFNGSLFNVDWHVIHENGKSETYNADYRRWGNSNLMQNTRLPYWAMLHAGDFEMMTPFFRWYERLLPAARKKCEKIYGHDGLLISDNMSIWGSPSGWTSSAKDPASLYQTWQFHYYSPELEFLMLALDYFEFTGDQNLLRELILPLWEGAAQFYRNHFERDEDGKLIIQGTSLEQYHDAINPLPCVAGLGMVGQRMLSLTCAGESIGELTRELLAMIPEIPLCKVSTPFPISEARMAQAWRPLGLPLDIPPGYGEPEQTRIAPAQELRSEGWNVENPELYAIFPYRAHCISNGDLELAKRSYLNRRFTHNWGWAQDPIQAAMCGLAAEAKSQVEARFHRKFRTASFPAFWDIGFDWVPDMDNGAVASRALQSMLIQHHEEKILLFPAWPKEWDVEFRIFAPMQTTVEGRLEAGKLKELKVTPPERAGFVHLPAQFTRPDANSPTATDCD